MHREATAEEKSEGNINNTYLTARDLAGVSCSCYSQMTSCLPMTSRPSSRMLLISEGEDKQHADVQSLHLKLSSAVR